MTRILKEKRGKIKLKLDTLVGVKSMGKHPGDKPKIENPML